jgi:hypothetical protein
VEQRRARRRQSCGYADPPTCLNLARQFQTAVTYRNHLITFSHSQASLPRLFPFLFIISLSIIDVEVERRHLQTRLRKLQLNGLCEGLSSPRESCIPRQAIVKYELMIAPCPIDVLSPREARRVLTKSGGTTLAGYPRAEIAKGHRPSMPESRQGGRRGERSIARADRVYLRAAALPDE